jgi:hypothetical protein
MEYEKKCKIVMGEKEVSPQGRNVSQLVTFYVILREDSMIYDIRLKIFDF